MSTSGLLAIELLRDCTEDDIAPLARDLEPRTLSSGDALLRQGEDGAFFALLLEGEAVVEREVDGTVEEVARAGPGSVLGELALLLGRRRSATVRAVGELQVVVGGADELARLIGLPGVHDRIEGLASRRLAESLRPVAVTLRDGGEILLRPLLPADRAAYASAIDALSADSLRRRFLSGGHPNSRMIDYLVDIDYVDHFAWVVQEPDHRDELLGTARFVRLHARPDHAEVAFEVVDEHQGRGIASLLLGAIGVAARSAAVERLVATVLLDNAPMRAVFAKAGADAGFGDPGELHIELSPDAAAALLDDGLRAELELAVRDIVQAAGLALTRPPD